MSKTIKTTNLTVEFTMNDGNTFSVDDATIEGSGSAAYSAWKESVRTNGTTLVSIPVEADTGTDTVEFSANAVSYVKLTIADGTKTIDTHICE